MSKRYWIAPYKDAGRVLGWAPAVYDYINMATDSVNSIPSPTPNTAGAIALCVVRAVSDTAMLNASNIVVPPTGGVLGGLPVQGLDTRYNAWSVSDQTLFTNTMSKFGISYTPHATDTYRQMLQFLAQQHIPGFTLSDIDLFDLSV